mmetsp:Transcript_2355/g.7048  ORF Transcript_2355/g.7048 Transcript_2355/m.7048 type:complete len:446 (-) Transcript_2355:223-1560(-)
MVHAAFVSATTIAASSGQRWRRVCCAERDAPRAARRHWRQLNERLRRTWEQEGIVAAAREVVGDAQARVENFNQVLTLARRDMDAAVSLVALRTAAKRGAVDALSFKFAMETCDVAGDGAAAREVMAIAKKMGFSHVGKLVRDYLGAVWRGEGLASAKQEFDRIVDECSADSLEVQYAVGTIVTIMTTEQRVDDAMDVLKLHRGLALPPKIYNTLLSACSKLGRARHVEGLLLLMRQSNVVPDIATYNTLLRTFHRMKTYDKVDGLWEEMQRQGITVSVTSYNIMINYFVDSSRAEEAGRLFQEMQDRGLQPDEVTYTTLIKAFGRIRESKRAVEILEALEQTGRADVATYRATVRACLSNGDAVQAHRLMLIMDERGQKMRANFWFWLLHACVAAGEERCAIEVLDKIVEQGMEVPHDEVVSLRAEIHQLGGFSSLQRKLSDCA